MSSTDTSTAPQTRPFEGVDVPAAGRYVIDASHTTVGFSAKHLMVSKVRGRFSEFEGVVTIAEHPLESSVQVTLQAASIDSRSEDRDAHLRSPDFLDVEQFPTLDFHSTAVRHTGGEDFEVDGVLTIKGVSRPVTLAMELEGVAQDPWGGHRMAFSAETDIDREDWGLTWNVALETGGVLVSKKVTLEIEGQAVLEA
jgi:polyisoprenoid-binding protein YceI